MSTKTLSELGHDSCMLAALIEGLDALHHSGDGAEDCPLAKRARNAMPVVLDLAIEKAWALNEEIERAALASKKK